MCACERVLLYPLLYTYTYTHAYTTTNYNIELSHPPKRACAVSFSSLSHFLTGGVLYFWCI